MISKSQFNKMEQLASFVFRIKSIFLFSILVSKSLSLNGQVITNQNIESLQRVANRLQVEINIKTDSLNLINEEINRQKIKAFQTSNSQNDGFSIVTTSRQNGKIRKSNTPISDVILNLKEGDTIKLTDYQKGYWVVNVGPFYGFLSDLYVNQNDSEIAAFKKQLELRNEEYRILKLQEKDREQRLMEQEMILKDKLIKEENSTKEKLQMEIARKNALQRLKDKKDNLYSKYGKEIADKLLNKFYWIGMTTEMAEISLGSPRNKNKSVGRWGVNEQWVYYSTYLYFENGKLTSYQKTE
jgi:hypothetical protein